MARRCIRRSWKSNHAWRNLAQPGKLGQGVFETPECAPPGYRPAQEACGARVGNAVDEVRHVVVSDPGRQRFDQAGAAPQFRVPLVVIVIVVEIVRPHPHLTGMEQTSDTATPLFANLRSADRPGQLVLVWFVDQSGQLSSRWVVDQAETSTASPSAPWPLAS